MPMNEPKIISLSEFKTLAAQGMVPAGVGLRKAYTCSHVMTKADTPSLGDREVQIVISTASPDRDKDTISAAGWKLANYKKNPVVLWSHDYRSLPLARARKVWVGEDDLRSIDHFVERDIYPMADVVLQMLQRGYLNAASVGFAPSKWMINEDRGGVDFEEQELLEHSIVPVPANAEALVEMRSIKGIDLRPLVEWAEKFIDETGATDRDLPVSPAKVAEMLKHAKGGRIVLGWAKDAKAAVPKADGFTFQAIEPLDLTAKASDNAEDEDEGEPETPPAKAATAKAQKGAAGDAVLVDGQGLFVKHGFVVQSLIFPKRHWNDPEQVRTWARSHGFRADRVETGDSSFGIRQREAEEFSQLRTIALEPAEASAVEPGTKVRAVGGSLKASGEPRLALPSFEPNDLDAGLVVAGWLETLEKGVLPYRRAPLAAEGESWDGAAEVEAAAVDDLKAMSTWFGGDGTKKEDFKLAHHKTGGEHPVVWKGVAAAAARLPQSDLPAADQAGVRRHLARHYEDFGKEAPWKSAPGPWEKFEATSKALRHSVERDLTGKELGRLLRGFGFEAEARSVEEVAETAAVNDLLTDIGLDGPGTSKAGEGEGSDEPVTGDQLREMFRGPVQDMVDERIRRAQGRLD